MNELELRPPEDAEDSVPSPPSLGAGQVSGPAVLVAVFAIATCGLVYELIAGTLASYVLGDSVTQFSTVIGVYLSAMGLGAWLSRYIETNVVARFIEVEIGVALIGGSSAALLFLAFAELSHFHPILYSMVLIIGTLVGLEIPLLMRILKDHYDLKDLIARVLTVDYLGALVASLAFPIFLVPKLGLVRGALAIGCLNAVVAFWSCFLFAPVLTRRLRLLALRVEAGLVLILLLVGVAMADQLTSLAEDDIYPDPIVYAKNSSYQRIVLTRGGNSFQLYLNGHLQFSSADEVRYHEALVHPPMSVFMGRHPTANDLSVLILGGGDGLALREVLKYGQVDHVTMVDLDPMMTQLAREQPLLADLNRHSLKDPRVELINDDAFVWLSSRVKRTYDVVLIDFPDPNSFSLGKLYTSHFYRMVARAIRDDSVIVVQATSPFLARKSFWCVAETMEAAGFFTRGYHANVPSFGEWGYILASKQAFDVPNELPQIQLGFLTPETMQAMFVFSRDMSRIDTDVNKLNNQILVQYYDDEWSRW